MCNLFDNSKFSFPLTKTDLREKITKDETKKFIFYLLFLPGDSNWGKFWLLKKTGFSYIFIPVKHKEFKW